MSVGPCQCRQRSACSVGVHRGEPRGMGAHAGALFGVFELVVEGVDVRSGTIVSIASAAMAEQQVYTLPDNSRVTINAKSSISLRRDRWPEQRNLRLRGEAYFDVEQGQRFIVQTSLGAVEVLGTRFNVFQRDTFFEVRCYEGRVGVRNVQLDTMQFELRAGEGVRRKAGSLQRFTFENRAQLATWTQGTFRYDRTALAVVLEELERQFDVEIWTTDEVQISKDYSGFFSLDSLEEALYSVCWPMGLNYRIEGDNVEISKRQEK